MYDLHRKRYDLQENVPKSIGKQRAPEGNFGRRRAASSDDERRRSASRTKYVKTQHVEALWCQNKGIRFLKKQNRVYILIRSKDLGFRV